MKVQQDHVDRVIADWKRERPDYDLAPVEIVGRFGRIMEYIDKALEDTFQEFGISRASFDVLATLRRGGAPYRMTQRDLMLRLLRTSGSMSLRIDALERDGFVSRSQDQEDRRTVFVTLKPKGITLLEKVIPAHLANESALLNGFSKSERDQMKVLLRKWLVFLETDASCGRQVHLGMTLLEARSSLMRRRAVGLPDIPGILIHAVKRGSWADDAGLRRGDLICGIDGKNVRSISDIRAIHSQPRLRTTRFRIIRGAAPIEIQATF